MRKAAQRVTLWLIAAATLASAQAAEQPPALDARGLLAAACASPLTDGVCRKAKDYPTGADCWLEAAGAAIAGRFLAGRRLVLAPYRSNCEPHLHDWGGSLVAQADSGRWRFLGYLVGLAGIDGCVTAGPERAKETLICRHRFVGLGFALSDVSAYEITQNGAALGFRRKVLATASDATATYGAPLVRCSGGGEAVVAFETPLHEVSGRVVEARASVASRAENCQARAVSAPDMRLPEGAALALRLRRARIRIDIATDAVSPPEVTP